MCVLQTKKRKIQPGYSQHVDDIIDKKKKNNNKGSDDEVEESLQSKSVKSSCSSSLSLKGKKLDYKSPLRFYSQVGHIDTANNDTSESPESALHIILPNDNIFLGYSVGYKIDDSMDIVDGSVWLYRPQNYENNLKINIFYLCLLLTLFLIIDFILICLILFDKNEDMIHFNLTNYNGGNSLFVITYYLTLLVSIIGSIICIWCNFLQILCIFYSSFITDLIFCLFWMEHHLQFIHWSFIIMNCYLLMKYLLSSFGKWDYLQSQARLDELEQLHREGRF